MLRRLVIASAALVLLAPATALAIDFKPYGRGAFAEIRGAHRGRPLIVHFWSVTCPACLAELPEWAKIARENKAVEVVFVNADPETDRKRAGGRLEKAGLADAANYGFADDFAERLYFEADHDWRGELPFSALIAADGGQTNVTGGLDEPQMAEWLAKVGK